MLRLVLLLNFIYALASVTHLVLQNNDIYTKERSEYDLTEFSSLQKVLEQDDLVKNADVLLNKLESVKRNIVDDAPLLNSGEDEITESDCLESGLLSDFDFSILPALEKEYEGYSQFEQYMCVTGAVGNVPLCSTTPSTFYMGDYRHITGVSSITARSGSPAYALLAFIPTDDIASYGHCLHQYLQKESTNWHAYFGASFYWRLLGNDGAALECIFKSLYYAQNNVEYRDGPLVSLSNLLSNAGHDSDAALVMEHSAESPYLQQLKTWSAGNLYTLAEQYKLSLDLYNRTVKLGPFPLADGRLQTLECYRTVIHRMENQNNVLRATLQKLQQRHQLETQYVGIQEQMFSNLRNSSLPAHIIEQVQSTEEAVRNTYKLVLEQQEIQNTLSASNVRAVFAEEMTEEEMTEEEMTEEDALSTERQEGAKKDVDWIKSTRFKLEKLVEQIKAQLSESVDVPIIYNCEDAVSCGTDAETLALIADAEEKRIMTELMTSVKKEANSRRVPVACDQNAAPGDVQDTARDAQDTPRDVQDTARDAHATSDDEHVASQNFMLFTDMFPFSEQINGEENREGCEVVKGESDSWYHLKCKVSDENIRKVKKDVKIVIREQSPKSASIELITEGSPESILPHIHITLDRDLRKKLVPTERSKTEYDGETLNKLISAHIQTDDIFRTMQDIRQDKINHNTENIENSVDINFGEDSWILRFYRVDTSPTRVVRIEQCDKYIPIFSHGDAYLPLMSPLLPYQDS